MRLTLFLLVASAAAYAQRATVLDNEFVRVLDVTETSVNKGRPHEHANNRVMIYLTEGKQKLEFADGRTEVLDFKAGTPLWSAAGGVHTSQNIGGKPFRVIEVELRKPASGNFKQPALDPVRVDPSHYRIVHDYPQARVILVDVPGKAQIPMHEHTPNRVIVFLTETRTAAVDEAGQRSETVAKPGEVRWAGAVRHREENLLPTPFKVIVVELK